jgi:hypothetical protein
MASPSSSTPITAAVVVATTASAVATRIIAIDIIFSSANSFGFGCVVSRDDGVELSQFYMNVSWGAMKPSFLNGIPLPLMSPPNSAKGAFFATGMRTLQDFGDLVNMIAVGHKRYRIMWIAASTREWLFFRSFYGAAWRPGFESVELHANSLHDIVHGSAVVFGQTKTENAAEQQRYFRAYVDVYDAEKRARQVSLIWFDLVRRNRVLYLARARRQSDATAAAASTLASIEPPSLKPLGGKKRSLESVPEEVVAADAIAEAAMPDVYNTMTTAHLSAEMGMEVARTAATATDTTSPVSPEDNPFAGPTSSIDFDSSFEAQPAKRQRTTS